MYNSTEASDLDSAFDLVEWRSNVDKNILQLERRILSLEKKQYVFDGEKPSLCKKTSFSQCNVTQEIAGHFNIVSGEPLDSFATADFMGIEYLPTFITLIKSKRHAQLQLLYLLGCSLLFIYYGVIFFLVAKANEDAEFKPETKRYVINYNSTDEAYEIPYIYIYWYIEVAELFENASEDKTAWLNQHGSWLTNQMLESQDHFNNSAVKTYINNSTDYFRDSTGTTANASIDSRLDSDEYGFWGFFKLKLGDPDPAKGSWHLFMLLDVEAMSLNGSVSLEYLFAIISREETPNLDGYKFMLNLGALDDNETVDVFMVRYDETVTHEHGGKVTYDVRTTLESASEVPIDLLEETDGIIASNSEIVLYIIPDLEVEHWFEYIAYGYGDWLAGMGGLMSLMTAAFFWVSYYTATYFGNGISMGILPSLSFIFSSYEDVHWIKDVLRQSGVV